MSVAATKAVRRFSEAELGARLVLLELADAARDDGVCWPKLVEIARNTRLHVRTVQRELESLLASGEVEMRKAQRGRLRFNVYRVVLPGVQDVDYDRLERFGVHVKEPFTTWQFARSSDVHDTQDLHGRQPSRHGNLPGTARASKQKASEVNVIKERTNAASPPRNARKPNLIFNACCAIEKLDPHKLNNAEGGRIGRAKKLILESVRATWNCNGDDVEFRRLLNEREAQVAEEITRRSRRYVEKWPNVTCTAMALASHWSAFEKADPVHEKEERARQRSERLRERMAEVLARA